MADGPGGLTASIRRKLQEGRTPDEIVQELVAGGLGQVSAQRFVDRALAEHASGAAVPPPPPAPELPAAAANEPDALDQFIQEKSAETDAVEARTGGKALWFASLLMCAGIVITAGTYAMAGPGGRYTLMWGPAVFGLLLWVKAVVGGLSHARSFAWVSAAASIALPIVLAVAALGLVAATEPPPPQADAQAQLVEMLQSKNTSEERYAALEKAYDDQIAARRASLDVDKLLAAWDDPAEPDEPGRSRLQCDIALQMASYTGEHRQWLAEQLANRIPTSPDGVKICNARTILELDWDAGTRIYAQWAIGDNPRLKSAATIAMRRAR